MLLMKVRQRTELSDGFIITIEDGRDFKVSEELYFTHYLYEKDDLSEKEIEELLFFDKVLEAETLCRKKLAGGLKPRRRLFDYLKESGFNEREAEAALDKLEKGKYIDDFKFAAKKIKRKMNTSPLSRNALVLWLEAQGVGIEVAEKAVDFYNVNDRETIKKLINRKFKDTKDVVKISKYLASKGFDRDIIAEATKTEDLWNV